MPLRPLDRIFYRGDVRHCHTFTAHSGVARQASDHLPLIVDFELEKPTLSE